MLHVLQLLNLVDIHVEASKLLTFRKHKWCDLTKQVVRDDQGA